MRWFRVFCVIRVKILIYLVFTAYFVGKLRVYCVLRSGSKWFLACHMRISNALAIWRDSAIRCAWVPYLLRESSSGENLDIYSAHLSIFRRKIDDILCSTKRIEVIFGMAHAHKSYACNRMRQGNRLWVGSVNFAWFGWKCRYLWCLEPILMENRWIIVFYEVDRGNLWHGVSA